ncbi:MAG: transglutaminase-like domain-containing protein [Candidatus Omnitrophota bacterium]|nr:transglutaminase-like domain-containing protein [Candidatus Omnitrophota bacterium]
MIAVAVAFLWSVGYWPVHSRQGINYEVTQHTLPLSLKLAGFAYRDMEYRHLASALTRGISGDEARVLRLYGWVRAHIAAGNPPGLPVVDDHVWNIIVRGYGDPDQLADVLATLCAYAGIPAEMAMLGPPDGPPVHAVTMVKLEGRWCPLDPFYGIIVRHPDGRLMSREEFLADPSRLSQAAGGIVIKGVEYSRLYAWLPEIDSSGELRPYRHMPLRRAWYEFKRAVRLVRGMP